MGIINVNDDSFCGDGTLDFEVALELARQQVAAGADVIDIGAESARTNRWPIAVAEELRRLRGFLARWPEAVAGLQPRDDAQVWPPVVSANTWRPATVAQLLESRCPVELLNDMGALPDDRNARWCAAAGVSLLIMHSVGEPKVPHVSQSWPDVMASMEEFFAAKLAVAEAAGLERERIVIDPGLDFAKQRDDNLRVLRELARLQVFGRPVLVPVSRKTVIGGVLGLAEPRERDPGTVACLVAAVRRGAQILRVHHVDAAWQALRVVEALRTG